MIYIEINYLKKERPHNCVNQSCLIYKIRIYVNDFM